MLQMFKVGATAGSLFICNALYADLVQEIGMAEGVRRYPIILQWSAEFYKSFKKPYRIVGRVVDPHVKVFSCIAARCTS